ncbi:DEKNAAC104975 [Brettanomyces naardenensis]|uniref:GrpE protein homolog n=1 Tax=Brettanomyces naardenensis TaxID=13370 RepID=A0A448YS83_BRENA|nr:DEKNAAC104975 [Brettanomyces naardenensis]
MQRSLSLLSRSLIRANGLAAGKVSYGTAVNSFAVLNRRQFSSTPRFLYAKEEGAGAKKDDEKKPAEEEEVTEEQAEKDVQAVLDATKEALDSMQKENAQLKDRYMRAVADFRNLQGTSQREMQKARDFALQKFSKDLLETIDNFDHALNAVKDEDRSANDGLSRFFDGIKMTKDVFEKTLQKHGLKRIDPLDEEFDPNRHEAVFQVAVPGKEPGTVCMVQQTGYELNGRVLRAAKVGVAKAAEK